MTSLTLLRASIVIVAALSLLAQLSSASPSYANGGGGSSEEVSLPFFNLFFSRDVDRRSGNPLSGSSLGSEFLGRKRKRVPGSEFLGKRVPGSEFLGKRVPGSEFLGKRAPGSEFLGKRAPGSEFLGKRAPGSEFLGKRTPEIPSEMSQSDRDRFWSRLHQSALLG